MVLGLGQISIISHAQEQNGVSFTISHNNMLETETLRSAPIAQGTF